jgi:hypothetical protein
MTLAKWVSAIRVMPGPKSQLHLCGDLIGHDVGHSRDGGRRDTRAVDPGHVLGDVAGGDARLFATSYEVVRRQIGCERAGAIQGGTSSPKDMAGEGDAATLAT